MHNEYKDRIYKKEGGLYKKGPPIWSYKVSFTQEGCIKVKKDKVTGFREIKVGTIEVCSSALQVLIELDAFTCGIGSDAFPEQAFRFFPRKLIDDITLQSLMRYSSSLNEKGDQDITIKFTCNEGLGKIGYPIWATAFVLLSATTNVGVLKEALRRISYYRATSNSLSDHLKIYRDMASIGVCTNAGEVACAYAMFQVAAPLHEAFNKDHVLHYTALTHTQMRGLIQLYVMVFSCTTGADIDAFLTQTVVVDGLDLCAHVKRNHPALMEYLQGPEATFPMLLL